MLEWKKPKQRCVIRERPFGCSQFSPRSGREGELGTLLLYHAPSTWKSWEEFWAHTSGNTFTSTSTSTSGESQLSTQQENPKLIEFRASKWLRTRVAEEWKSRLVHFNQWLDIESQKVFLSSPTDTTTTNYFEMLEIFPFSTSRRESESFSRTQQQQLQPKPDNLHT